MPCSVLYWKELESNCNKDKYLTSNSDIKLFLHLSVINKDSHCYVLCFFFFVFFNLSIKQNQDSKFLYYIFEVLKFFKNLPQQLNYAFVEIQTTESWVIGSIQTPLQSIYGFLLSLFIHLLQWIMSQAFSQLYLLDLKQTKNYAVVFFSLIN